MTYAFLQAHATEVLYLPCLLFAVMAIRAFLRAIR